MFAWTRDEMIMNLIDSLSRFIIDNMIIVMTKMMMKLIAALIRNGYFVASCFNHY